MKHIVIDARIISSSTGTYIERILNYLQEIDTVNRYTVLVFSKDKEYWKPTNPNFEVIGADFKNYSIAEQIGLKKLLDKLSPDLVHFCMPQQPVLYKGLHVTTIHDMTLMKTYNTDKNWLVYHLKQLVGRFVFKWVARTSAYVITISKFSKNEVLNFTKIPSDKVVVTPLSADTFDDKISPYKTPFKQFLLYVGQQSDYKNIRRLGDAHQELLKKYPDLGLILVGSIKGGTVNNQNYFENKGYKNIHFTGFLPNPQRDWLYKNAAAYVFPSTMEGFGLPGLEAMGYGAPVVSSNATCLPEVYGGAAHYFDPFDTNDMVRAIDDVLSNSKLRSELIKKGYKQIAKYSWRRTAEQTHGVYMSALSTKNRI
ncbi:glycosyltransferase family 4 protein [Candidatus Saccharibacteria bacterium]|nr:glycosyltransferase family 4 protein [Candidatus Saccharibacteria bacterium]